MNYKRLEIYTGWKCNHKCIFCIEYPNIEKAWNIEITEDEIKNKLIKYRKRGYNHVTFLGGEPFIHKVFSFAILFAKKIGFIVMVTTNASTLQFKTQGEKYLKYIDELIISIPIINEEKQLFINNTKAVINFDAVFNNIEKFWKGNFLKVNTVINKFNLLEITNIINYIGKYGVREMSITYPDIIMPYYSKKNVLTNIAPKYEEVKKRMEEWFIIAKKRHNIKLVFTDIPFCMLSNLEYYKNTEDFIYDVRTKIDIEDKELNRKSISPRRRKLIDKCSECIYNNKCWGPSIYYNELYGLEEINPIIK